MNSTKNEIIAYLETVSIFILGAALFFFPLVFSSLTTDPFMLPKQILLGSVVLLSLLFFALRMVMEGRVRLRTTPFDLPLFLFALVLFASAMFSLNRYDSLMAFVPLLFAILAYFVAVNLVRGKMAINFIASCLVGGGVVASLLSLLSLLKIYLLPLSYTRVQTFTTSGSLLDQALYLTLILPVAGYFALPMLAKLDAPGATIFKKPTKTFPEGLVIGHAVSFIILLLGLIGTVYMLVVLQKPLILPFETGFQTAFAAISQDSGRVIQSFFLGSGYGTYITDFTRFKQAAYNTNPTLWSVTFFRSSSYFLEMLATTGFLGIVSLGFLVFRLVQHRQFSLPLLLALTASLLLPFSYLLQALFFLLLALLALFASETNPKRYPELEFYFVTLKRSHGDSQAQSSTYAKLLPVFVLAVVLLLAGSLAYLSTRYVLSDLTFQRSVVAANENKAEQTYKFQVDAIQAFPYRDTYYRVFSQTNLALASAVVKQQPKNSSPSAQTQQQISQLIQQSISAGRSAVSLSPLSVSNWYNLSGVYRSLIGFGQNADQFAILTNQQAITYDPVNPQGYINLGGIYYQLKLWDQAQNAFEQAIRLKPDFANAYYNLGHALEEKGDLANALQMYEKTKTLLTGDKESLKKISAEIEALKKKIATAQANKQQSGAQAKPGEQAPLDVNKPVTQLPERNPKVQIPGPSVSPTPQASPTPLLSPGPAR